LSMTPEQIDLWRAADVETQRLEFKEAKTGFDQDKIYQYCVAIANEGGGFLVFGVKDAPPRDVVGTTAVNDPIGMAEKLFQKLGFRVDVEEVDHPVGRVVVFSIPGRPTGTAYHLDGRYLMRSGSSLVAMSEDQLRRIFSEGEPGWLEQYSVNRLTVDEVVGLLDVPTFFKLLDLPAPQSNEAAVQRLVDERLADKVDGSYSIRRMGALLLARDLSAFPDVERKAARVVVYDGTSKLKTKLEQVGTKGYAVGFQGLVGFVGSQLPQNEVIEDALRREVKLVPDDVVRELVANALIHQDLTVGGTSVMIEVYDNRVEISESGGTDCRGGAVHRRLPVAQRAYGGIDAAIPYLARRRAAVSTVSLQQSRRFSCQHPISGAVVDEQSSRSSDTNPSMKWIALTESEHAISTVR